MRGRRKPKMNRGSAWSDNEIKALISIRGNSKIQEELDGAVRNKTVYVHIQKKLAEQGYDHDRQQCRSKIKNLKGETGRGRKTCKFYKELDNILGHSSHHSTGHWYQHCRQLN